MLNFLIFLYLKPLIFLRIPSRNNNTDFDYLKNKENVTKPVLAYVDSQNLFILPY